MLIRFSRLQRLKIGQRVKQNYLSSWTAKHRVFVPSSLSNLRLVCNTRWRDLHWWAWFPSPSGIDGDLLRDPALDQIQLRGVIGVWPVSLLEVSFAEKAIWSTDWKELRALMLATRVKVGSSYLFKLGPTQLMKGLEIDLSFLRWCVKSIRRRVSTDIIFNDSRIPFVFCLPFCFLLVRLFDLI